MQGDTFISKAQILRTQHYDLELYQIILLI